MGMKPALLLYSGQELPGEIAKLVADHQDLVGDTGPHTATLPYEAKDLKKMSAVAAIRLVPYITGDQAWQVFCREKRLTVKRAVANNRHLVPEHVCEVLQWLDNEDYQRTQNVDYEALTIGADTDTLLRWYHRLGGDTANKKLAQADMGFINTTNIEQHHYPQNTIALLHLLGVVDRPEDLKTYSRSAGRAATGLYVNAIDIAGYITTTIYDNLVLETPHVQNVLANRLKQADGIAVDKRIADNLAGANSTTIAFLASVAVWDVIEKMTDEQKNGVLGIIAARAFSELPNDEACDFVTKQITQAAEQRITVNENVTEITKGYLKAGRLDELATIVKIIGGYETSQIVSALLGDGYSANQIPQTLKDALWETPSTNYKALHQLCGVEGAEQKMVERVIDDLTAKNNINSDSVAWVLNNVPIGETIFSLLQNNTERLTKWVGGSYAGNPVTEQLLSKLLDMPEMVKRLGRSDVLGIIKTVPLKQTLLAQILRYPEVVGEWVNNAYRHNPWDPETFSMLIDLTAAGTVGGRWDLLEVIQDNLDNPEIKELLPESKGFGTMLNLLHDGNVRRYEPLVRFVFTYLYGRVGDSRESWLQISQLLPNWPGNLRELVRTTQAATH